MSEIHSIEDYKKYVKELKLKIRRLQDKNKDLVSEVVVLRSQASSAQVKEKVAFSLDLTRKVIRVQSIWRGLVARRQFRKTLSQRPSEPPRPVTYGAQKTLQKAQEAAKRARLTLEALHRAADRQNTGKVPLEEFRAFLLGMKLRLSPAVVARFLYLVDEDCTGTVSREDYLLTLAAFGVNSEEEWNKDTRRTFEQQCMIKLALAMRQDRISVGELRKRLGAADSSKVSIEKFNKVVDGLKMSFKEREKFAMNVMLDPSGVGSFQGGNLMTELERAMKAAEDPQMSKIVLDLQMKKPMRLPTARMEIAKKQGIDPQVAAGMQNHQASAITSGGVVGGISDPDQQMTVADDNMRTIVRKIEGHTPMSIFLLSTLDNCTLENDHMSLDQIESHFNNSYGRVLNRGERGLLLKSLDINRTNTVEGGSFGEVAFHKLSVFPKIHAKIR